MLRGHVVFSQAEFRLGEEVQHDAGIVRVEPHRQRYAAGSHAMKKVLRWVERIAHSIGVLLGIVAIVWIGVIVGRPPEKSGNQQNFAGAEQQKKRLAVFLDGTWNSVNSNTNVWRM